MTLRAMTYNLKNASDDDFPPWEGRRPLIAELIERHRPHIFGTQEGHYRQIRAVAGDPSPAYEWIGIGRHGGSRSEFNAIVFDPCVAEPIEWDNFWLSETPDAVGSKTPAWDHDVVRMATWARFAVTLDGVRRELVWLNTHLDHRSEIARRRGAALIVERLSEVDGPVVISGDFNTGPDSPVLQVFADAGYADTFTVSRTPPPQTGTCLDGTDSFADTDSASAGKKIDFLLVGGGIEVVSVAVDAGKVDGRGPSDHAAVLAELDLPGRPARAASAAITR